MADEKIKPIKCSCGFYASEDYLKPVIEQEYESWVCPKCGRAYKLK